MTTGYGLIASAIYFANANNNGEADYNNASNVNGVRPLLRAPKGYKPGRIAGE